MPPLLKKKSFWIVIAAFLGLAWAAQTTYRALTIHQENVAHSILNEGDEMPADMPLVSFEGKATTFKEFAGKVVMVNFWAAWCAPCLKEMPSIYSLYKQQKPKGFEVVGVTMDEDLGQGLATLAGVAGQPPFLIVKGIEQPIANRFAIEGLPFTVIVDRKGVIRYSKPGERDWDSKESQALVEGMM